MIGLPFNDHKCLGSITEVIAELVANVNVRILGQNASTENSGPVTNRLRRHEFAGREDQRFVDISGRTLIGAARRRL